MWDLIQYGIIHVSRSEGGNCAVAGGLTGPSLRSRQAWRTQARTKSFLSTSCGEIEKQRALSFEVEAGDWETKWRRRNGANIHVGWVWVGSLDFCCFVRGNWKHSSIKAWKLHLHWLAGLKSNVNPLTTNIIIIIIIQTLSQ